MPAIEKTCYIWKCDNPECEEVFEDSDVGIYHFDSPDEARSTCIGVDDDWWHETEDGRVLCHECYVKRLEYITMMAEDEDESEGER